ncbi:DUF58 domain-containing protein [Swingsia samuiensis]|uniref:DUF58 domain-containing protein n=1 Tax=Swingsia samuiensis TaxID=1293412 RepID=UPI001FE87A94|nr:DUF58 domain-containing protein [Swingsia samuiensis]
MPHSIAAEAESIGLPTLLLQAERLAANIQDGRHGRRRSGSGEDFWQFRPYRSDEPITAIDWKQSARSAQEGALWVRDREQESTQNLLIWCDPSASMNWRSSENFPPKKERAQLCALALTAAALRGHERVGLLNGPEAGRTFSGKHNLEQIGEALLYPSSSDADFPDLARIPPRSDIVIISDFLWEDNKLHTFLKQSSNLPARIHLLCVLDPEERSLHQSGRVRFSGLEGGALVLPAMETLTAEYEKAMNAHLEILQTHASQFNTQMILHETSHNPLPALLALYATLGSGQ